MLYSFSKVFAHLFIHDSIELGQSARKSAIIFGKQYKCCLKNLKRMEDIFSLHPNECCAETAELNLKFRNQAVKESGVYTVLIESFVMKI